MKTYTDIQKLENIVTVDVGLHTAIAWWRGDEEPSIFYYQLNRIGNLSDYLKTMTDTFFKILKTIQLDTKIKRVCIEGTQAFSSLKSQTSINSGNLFSLSYLVGGYATVCIQEQVNFEIIKPSQWKGQLNKSATKKRVEIITNKKYKNEHIYDAVGMGLSFIPNLWNLKEI